jgi:hypothetical protein
MIENLPPVHEALSSMPSTEKERKREGETKGGREGGRKDSKNKGDIMGCACNRSCKGDLGLKIDI